MKKIRYAIAGFGGIAETRIAREGFALDTSRFASLRYAEAVGAYDPNSGRRSAAATLGLSWYDDYRQLLADSGVDAVYVASNNATHAELALAALRAGKHVIVEKPIATRISAARELVNTASRRRLALSVDHMMVYNSTNVLARQAVKDGRIGEVNDCCFHMEFAYGFAPEEATSWRCANVDEMGGPIGDVASHCFYAAEFILNRRIVEVNAVYLPKTMAIKAEDGAYVKFRTADGFSGSIRVSFCDRRGGLTGTLSNLGFEVYGSTGVLRSFGSMFQLSGTADEPYRIRLELENASGVRRLRPRRHPNIYQELIERHARSILKGSPVNAEDGLHNLELCAATHKSARQNGRGVMVD